MDTSITVGIVCHRGLEPERGGREQNEDNYLLARGLEARLRHEDKEEVLPFEGHGIMLAVADGMGGHDHGQLASEAAVRALARFAEKQPDREPAEALRRWMLKAHDRLFTALRERGTQNIGTTLVACWILGDRAHWAHVGDSRLYHFRETKLHQVTTDQTRGEFARRDGRDLPEDAAKLAQSFVFGSRGLGHDEGIRVDPGVDCGSVQLNPGDRLVLCSDGLHGFIDDYAIAEALRDAPEPGAASSWLMERAISSGSDDNITAVVVRIDEVPFAKDITDEEESYDLFEDGLIPE